MWATGGLLPDLTVVLDVAAGDRAVAAAATCTTGSSPSRTTSTTGPPALPRPRRGASPTRYLVRADGTREDIHAAVRERVAAAAGGGVVSVWADVIGQESAVETLQRAVADPAAMTHAWLFTGPPGSGRSVAARAFAAALECPDGGCGDCRECRTAMDGTHADVTVLATEGLSIRVEQARDLVAAGGARPSVGRWRVIIVEDADRLTERAADALLKALEEPTPRTVWILCAPSLEDVIITIRSRSRHVRLRTPPVEAVADLLVRRDGIDPAMALYAARAAQSHVGLARRLARDEGARIRRRDVIALAGRSAASATRSTPPPTSRRSPTEESVVVRRPSATRPRRPGCWRRSAPTRRPAPSRRTCARS